MDINIAIKKTAIYSLSAGLLSGFFVVFVLVMTRLISDFTAVSSFKISLLAAVMIALMFDPLRNRIQKIIDKVFYKKTYDYYGTIQKVSHELASMFDVRNIYQFVGDTILSTLNLRTFCLMAAITGGEFSTVYVQSAGKDRGEKKDSEWEDSVKIKKINKDSEVITFFKGSEEMVIKDELTAQKERLGEEKVNRFTDDLKQFKGEAVKPVLIDNKLSFLFILGEKLSDDIFTDEDVRLIDTISYQASIAIKNAWLYAEKINTDRLASIGMVSATFAHEIRNPLTSVKTFAQLMPEKYNDREFRENFSKIAVDEIDKIDRLIKDLMSFSSKGIAPPVEELDLVALMEDILEGVKMKLDLQKRSIKIEKIYNKDRIKIIGDSKKLQQSFLNIINNACQSMAENGILRVDIKLNNQVANLLISDTGRGIAPEDIPYIFDPFYTTKTKGVGLGLAISKKIVEDHEGSITVNSTLSKGTTFFISLPVASVQ